MRVEDAPAAGELHVRVWRETYAADMPAAFLAALDPAVSAETIRMRVEVDDPDARVLIAVDEDGEVVGMATAGVTRDADAPTAWELYSINTVAAVHGSGLGDRLLDAAIGARPASLWVLGTNARAQAFYRRHGFVADGATKVHEGSGQPEVRMVRSRSTKSRSGGASSVERRVVAGCGPSGHAAPSHREVRNGSSEGGIPTGPDLSARPLGDGAFAGGAEVVR